MSDGADTATVVWLAPVEEREDAVHALGEWGRARGIRMTMASRDSGAGALRVDLAVADRVERELDRAREAIASLDVDGAERGLARAEAILREHPELPQAAWLKAEVLRSWSARFARIDPKDDERAKIAWQEADALDGGRATGIGETPAPKKPAAGATLTIRGGEGRGIVVRVDGVTINPKSSSTYDLEVAPAEHQVVVYADGEPVFASWVAIAPSAARTAIDVHVDGGGSACDGAALGHVTRDGDRVHADGVMCGRWIAAVPGERRGSVLVAQCERATCGPFLEWRTFGIGSSGTPEPLAPKSTWPAWATWTLVGIGAAAATSVALVATGVFESRPTESRFVSNGAHVESR